MQPSSSKIKAIFNWSGGKDSALALYYCLQNPDIEVKYLLTTINDSVNRISMHGVREELLLRQSAEIGISVYQVRLPEMPDMQTYDATMRLHLEHLKSEGITHSIFGDIFLEDLKAYRDQRLAEVGLTGFYPLWKRDTNQLIDEFLRLGFGTVIACTQEKMGAFVGQEITRELIDSLPTDVDPCGENGEFHTFVFRGPIFKNEIKYQVGERVFKAYRSPTSTDATCNDSNIDEKAVSGFWYADLLSTP